MVEESVRKIAAKKTVRKAFGRTEAVTRTSRTKKVAAPETSTDLITRPRRKAPTMVTAAVAAPTRSVRMMQVGIGVFALLTIVGTVIGFTDQGSINVRAIIENRISAASPEERVRLEQAQNATANNLVDGGLIPSDTPPVIIESTASSTSEMASSTDVTASSTDDVVTDGVEELIVEPAPSEGDGLIPVDTVPE
ncbi:MAG: hypothetical protein AUK16_02670 [Parcubacteria group bacterium CG2_30_44_11]|nr:MAG: hypothetical protein AUK16_02670 [Parcubacteria group bacterium CG2_30_44_11]